MVILKIALIIYLVSTLFMLFCFNLKTFRKTSYELFNHRDEKTNEPSEIYERFEGDFMRYVNFSTFTPVINTYLALMSIIGFIIGLVVGIKNLNNK